MTTYGYVRVSTQEQDERRQLRSMVDAGVDPANLYVEKASGKDMGRPEWSALMGMMARGDTLVIDELSRMGRNFRQVTDTWRELRDRGVSIRILDASFISTDAFEAMGDVGELMEQMFLLIMAYMADQERKEMLRRQAEGIAVARAEGKYHGRKATALTDGQRDMAESMLREGRSQQAVADALGVHRNTVRKMVADGRLVA